MNLITTNDLKERLQSMCDSTTEIRDVLFYSTTGCNGVTVSKIVVIQINHYASFSNNISVKEFNTVEKALIHYMPKTSFAIVQDTTVTSANTSIPY